MELVSRYAQRIPWATRRLTDGRRSVIEMDRCSAVRRKKDKAEDGEEERGNEQHHQAKHCKRGRVDHVMQFADRLYVNSVNTACRRVWQSSSQYHLCICFVEARTTLVVLHSPACDTSAHGM